MAKQRPPDRTAGRDADAPATDDALAFRHAVRDVKPLAHAAPAIGLAKTRPKTRIAKRAAT
ncbi:MAG: hypothetical protein JWN43_3486, partial [Gammaproteobacteria bacterium]|nr:hypothetical protein [Gammaproteobacteria bacterium]